MAGRLRRPGAYALVLLVELLAGGAVVAVAVRAHESPPTAVTLLDRARAFVGREQAVRWSGRVDTEGDFTFEIARLRGEALMPDRFHVTKSFGQDAEQEILGVGADRYARATPTGEKPGAWVKLPTRPGPGQVGPPEGFGGPFGLPEEAQGVDAVVSHAVFVSPTGLPDALEAAEKPVVLRRDHGGAELRVGLVGPRLFGSRAAHLDQARLELRMRTDGRVDHVRLFVRAAQPDLRASVAYDLRAWGAKGVAVEAPPDDEVTDEPLVDRPALAGFGDVPLLMPKAVPEGWRLLGAGVLQADETVEGCPQAELDYADPDAPDEGYLDVYQFPLSCAQGPQGPVRPIEVGGRRGWVDDSEGERSGELYLGNAVFQFITSLSVEDLEVVLARLAPLDLDRAPDQLPGIGGGTETA